jgi:hypothetical protein
MGTFFYMFGGACAAFAIYCACRIPGDLHDQRAGWARQDKERARILAAVEWVEAQREERRQS